MQLPFSALGDASLHFWITQSVARAKGINFSEAMSRGAITRKTYADLVTRCRACPNAEACTARLAQPSSGLADVPDYCLNVEELNRLAAQLP